MVTWNLQPRARGIPAALGLTTRDWVYQRLGGYIRLSVSERREVVQELASEGLSKRKIADVLGVGKSTVDRDLEPVPFGPSTDKEPGADAEFDSDSGPNGTSSIDEDERVVAPPPRIEPASEFEKYCMGRWGFKDRRARQLIDAANVAKQLDDNTGTGVPDLLSSERQARALAPLVKEDPETARAVWREVNEDHSGAVTAPKIREAVQRVRRVADPEWVEAEYIEDPDPRIPDLKAAIQLLEPLYRDHDDALAPTIRAHTSGLRNALRRMQETITV